MSEYAPRAITALFDKIAASTSAVMSGVIGDAAHTYGYHRGRNYIPADDYSVSMHAEDRQGDGEAACGLDLTWGNASDQYTVSRRLLDAANDSRMSKCREFYGSVDGSTVCGYDYAGGYAVTSDDSHLWHVHISLLRLYGSSSDPAELDGIAAVITGGSGGGGGSTTPPPSSGGTLHRPWPSYMPTDQYFGLITGPNESHGGYYVEEQPDVRAIQERMQALGYAPSVAGWADGIFEQPTADAVAAWQRALYAAQTSRYGEVWTDDWQRLFTY